MLVLIHYLTTVILARLLLLNAINLSLKLKLLICDISFDTIALCLFHVRRLIIVLIRKTLHVGALAELLGHISASVHILLFLELCGRFMLVQ